MRAHRFLMLPLLALSATFGCPGSAAADPKEGGPAPVQITVKLEHITLAPGAVRQLGAASDELLTRGIASGGAVDRLRVHLAALITHSKVSVVDSLTITTNDGSAAQIRQSGRTGGGLTSASILPRFSGERITAELEIVYSGRTIRHTVTTPENAMVLVALPAPGDGTAERLLILTLKRAGP